MLLFVICDEKKISDRGLIFLHFFRLSCHWNVYCYLWCRLLPMVSFFLPLVLLPLVQFSNQKQEFLPMVHSCLWCCNNFPAKILLKYCWTFSYRLLLTWWESELFTDDTPKEYFFTRTHNWWSVPRLQHGGDSCYTLLSIFSRWQRRNRELVSVSNCHGVKYNL